MVESKVMCGGKFRVFSDGSVNRILPDGTEAPANISFASRGMKYAIVSHSVNGKRKNEYVHRLVAMAFLPNPTNLPVVNHKDGDARNNSAENLEWCSFSFNTQHAYETGLIDPYSRGRRCASCGKPIVNKNKSGLCQKCKVRVSSDNVKTIRENRVFFGIIEFHKKVEGLSNEDIGRLTGYAKNTIDDFLCGKRPSKKVAHKICELFSIDEDLFSVDSK